MQNKITLVKLDQDIRESRWIQQGAIRIEAFDLLGRLWPLSPGKHYKVDLWFEILDYKEPEIIAKTTSKAEQINETFAHNLYGYVKNNVFHVGDFQFDFEEFNEFGKFEGEYIKFSPDRVIVDFIEELN